MKLVPEWASFFTSYTYLVSLQNVFERFKSMLRASVCHSFSYPSEISEEQCLKRIPDMVRSRPRTFFLRLESDNSSPTTGL